MGFLCRRTKVIGAAALLLLSGCPSSGDAVDGGAAGDAASVDSAVSDSSADTADASLETADAGTDAGVDPSADSGADAETGAADAGATKSAVVTALEAILSGFVPASLGTEVEMPKIVAGIRELVPSTAHSENPCAGMDFASCQPTLLKTYVWIASTVLEQLTHVISKAIDSLPETGSGSTIMEDGNTLEYKITAPDAFSLLVKGDAEQPYLFLSVNGAHFEMSVDMSEEAGDSPSRVSATVDFVDEGNWTSSVQIVMACEEYDTRAPTRIALIIQRAGELWTGQAMRYHPLWQTMEEASCSSEPTSKSKTFFYTDFSGVESVAKGGIYVFDTELADVEEIASQGIDVYCAEHSCPGDASDYVNPFCIEAGASEAEWDSDCSGISDVVAAAEYLPTSGWQLPSDLESLEIDLPESL